MNLTKQELIDELYACIEQIKDLEGDLDQEVKVFHHICTGGFGGDVTEIDSFEMNFTSEDDGEVVLIGYEVNELKGI